MSRSAASERVVRSRPSKRTSPSTTSPGGDRIKRVIDSPVTVLPLPDSPTRQTVSPRATSKLTPSTARTVPSSV
jgi:hypothetical protein